MATHFALDPALLAEAVAMGGHKTEAEAVTAALAEYVRHRKQLGIIELMGAVEWDDDYDYKAARRQDLHRIPNDDDAC